MKFEFNWKNLLGLALLVVAVVVAYTTSTPIGAIVSIISATFGATISISEAVKKTDLVGFKKWIFLGGTIGGTVLFALGGYAEADIVSFLGAIVTIISLIFGAKVSKEKESE